MRVGAVGIGLAAAIAGGQGVASASTDDSSSSSADSASPGADGATSADDAGDTGATTPGARADDDDDADGAHPQTSTRGAESPGSAEAVEEVATGEDDEDPVGDSQNEESDEAPQAETADPDEASTPPLGVDHDEVADVASPAKSATATAPATATATASKPATATAKTIQPEEATTEVTAPVAMAAVSAAAPPQPGTSEWYFQGTLARAINRLAGWPGTPRDFVDITNHQTDQSLDTANNQLDGLAATAPFGSQARWLPDLISIVSFFFIPLPHGSTFTDKLNAMGDFLNRVVPPFTIEPGADTLDVITPYKIMGAAVVGTATVLQDMLNGIYDPVQWEIDVIKTTTGATVTEADLSDFESLSTKIAAAQTGAILTGGLIDGGAYYDTERAWEVTLPTWTADQVNPFTIVTYVALVGIYKRFQEMAVLTNFTTDTTYDSWLYTISLGSDATRSEYAAGTFHAVDPDGNGVDFFGVSQGGTFTSEGGALVTINTADGGFTYTNTLPGAAFFHRATSENEADRYDVVHIPVKSADGAEYTLPFRVLIIDGTNTNPTATHTSGSPDAAGVVKGKVTGSDSDGDALTYSLVGSSVNGLSGNSAYTKNGANNGGIVTIDPTTGDFTYVSTSTAPATQSFQVHVSDGHHGGTVVTVTVTNTTALTPANVNTSTQNVVTGSVPASTNSPGVFTGYALGAAPTKGAVTAFNPVTGAFTYTRNAALGHTTTPGDVVTVIATDAGGRTVTLRMAVQPTVANNAPSVTLTTAPTVGTLSGTTQTSTGKVTYSDSDGDAPVWTTATSARGGTVTFAADGTFTYTSNLTAAQRHAVARIGAAGSTYSGVSLAAWEDAFTATVADGFGGTAQITVKVPIYAINANPTLSTNNPACAFGVCTVTATTTDADGDDLSGGLNSSNNGTGSPWYTLTAGSVTINAGNQHTFSWTGNSNGLGTQVTVTNTYTIYDGHHRVSNGVVDSTYFARAWKTWTSSGTSTGN